MKTRQVHVGIVEHSAGVNVFVGWTVAEVYAKIYKYVDKWWSEFCDAAEMPEDHGTAILEYFTAAADKESFDVVDDELPFDWAASAE